MERFCCLHREKLRFFVVRQFMAADICVKRKRARCVLAFKAPCIFVQFTMAFRAREWRYKGTCQFPISVNNSCSIFFSSCSHKTVDQAGAFISQEICDIYLLHRMIKYYSRNGEITAHAVPITLWPQVAITLAFRTNTFL